MEEIPEVGGRRHTRVGYKAGRVQVRCKKSDPLVVVSLLDISVSGCLISMEDSVTVQPSDVVEVRFDLNSLVFRVLGFVRHASKAKRAIGIEFHHLPEQDRADLQEFVSFFAEA